MRTAKRGTCVLLVACLTVSTAGCGLFELLNLINVGAAAAKLFGGAANTVTQGEWQLLSSVAANLAGDPDLALTAEEAAAVAQFLADNDITGFDTIDDDPSNLQGLSDLAAAFQNRADEIAGEGTYDLTDPNDAEDFFEAYGQQLAQGLQESLQGLGIDIPGGGG